MSLGLLGETRMYLRERLCCFGQAWEGDARGRGDARLRRRASGRGWPWSGLRWKRHGLHLDQRGSLGPLLNLLQALC